MDGWMDEKDHQFEKRINNTIYTFTAIPIAPHPWEPDSILSFGLLPPLSYSLSLLALRIASIGPISLFLFDTGNSYEVFLYIVGCRSS